MQSKIIAAAVATTASAIRVQAPTTMLAQAAPLDPRAGVETDCHGTYMYQCMQTKVDAALDYLTTDTQDRSNLSQLKARDTRTEMVHGIEDLRSQLEMGLAANRKAGETAVREQMRGGMDRIEQRLADHVDSLRYQVLRDSPIAIRRKELEGDIKDVYYADQQLEKFGGREDKKSAIQYLLSSFIAEQFPVFGQPELDDLTTLVEQETEAICDAVTAATDSYSQAATDAAADMAGAIQANSDAMDTLNAQLIADMDARVAELVEEYLKIFWETIADIYSSVTYNERQGLVWKALYQKDAFVTAINAIRDDLVQQLGVNKSQLVEEMSAERDGLADFTAVNRQQMNAALSDMKADLVAAGDQALDDLKNEIERLSPQSPSHEQEIQNLKDFIYDLAVIRYNPNDSGDGHADGVQPYGEWVARRISDNIANAFHDSLRVFQGEGQDAVGRATATNMDQMMMLMTDNINLQNSLNAATRTLISELVAKRESLEDDLTADYDRITSTAEAEREADQIDFTSTKNQLWKDLSWLIRETLADGRHNHGYRAGPVFGFTEQLAQVAADGDSRSPNPVDLLEKRPAQGWGAEGPEDGYDPFGYGDQGFGFGPSQTQYQEVEAILAAYETAVAETVEKHEARMTRSGAEMTAELDQAWSDFQAQLDSKWASMTANVEQQTAAWTATLESRTATVYQALADARQAIFDAYVRKVAALDAEEKEIRWAITSVWNYDRQHALNEALTAAREAANAECDALRVGFEAQLDELKQMWDDWTVVQSADLDANTERALQDCEDAKADQTAKLTQFKDDMRAQYAAWEEKENSEFAAFMAASREAWMAIQVSYCLKHGQAGDITQVGHGCSWGTGAGAGNAGFKKGVAIEEHMESLTYGQDPIDIKHVYDEEWLIQGAVDWTMEGVPEEYARQLQRICDQLDAWIASVTATREALEVRLHTHINNANGRMVENVYDQAASLLAREQGVVASVNTDRLALEAEVDAKRVEVQWAIKELVWQLGYTQGYKFGGHDGEDANILAQITDLKDEYAALIAKQTEIITARVAKELADAEVAYAASVKAVDDLQAVEYRGTEQAISQAIAEFSAAIDEENAAFEAVSTSAYAGLQAFVNARLAAWQELYDQEAINAKWQEDSYYRLNLLRLLAEKQAAIDAAVADTYARFEADMEAKDSARATNQREQVQKSFAYYAFIRDTLTGYIADNDASIQAVVDQRRASLTEAMADQLAKFDAAMDEDRAEMKRLLKEIYNYNTHDLEATATATGSAAPFTDTQENGFAAKLTYFFTAQVRGKSAMLANIRDAYEATIQGALATAAEVRLDSDRKVQDMKDSRTRELSRLSQDEIISFDATMDAELGLLQDARAALETQVANDMERVRKSVIYAMHVLRYAGGYDVEQTGFGKGASSFHSTGNYLTGVSTLDDFRLPNRAGYAQVSEKINVNDDHHTKLEEMFAGAVAEADLIVATARAEFADRVAQDQQDSVDLAAQVNGSIAFAGTFYKGQLTSRIDFQENRMRLNNSFSKDALRRQTREMVAECTAINQANLDKVAEWIGDKREWVLTQMDSYQKKHLLQQLDAAEVQINDAIQLRTDEAIADAESANQRLSDALDAAEEAQQAHNAGEQSAFDSFVAQNEADTAAAIGGLVYGFFADSEAEGAGFSAAMDQTTKNWAYYLKYVSGYQGYESSIFQDFDPSRDYTDIMGYPSGDGAYSDLGTQGPDLGNSGEANQPEGGYGVGGQGGSDYLYSGDHTALAYGKFVGPDPAYFTGSILDPVAIVMDQEHVDLHYDHDAYDGLRF